MANKIPGIDVNKPNTNPTIDSEESYYEIPFYKDADYMFSLENEVAFIKAVERMVRTSKYYSRYIAHLKVDLGLNFCQVKGNISEDEDAGVKDLIEMHHGPIFTLFDVTSIILNYMLIKGMKITTFSVANKVIEEHFKHRVQTVMLCETVHQLVHDNKVFLNYRQGFGDLYSFLEIYYEGLDEIMVNKIIDYIEKCKKYDSNDFGNLNVIVTRWKTEHYDEDNDY
jgi:hypothetical protein